MHPTSDPGNGSDESSTARSSTVRSVDRAATLLELLAELGESRVTDLAARLDTHKSTASRLLATLAGHGLVEQDPDTATFRLGQGLVRLAGSVPYAFDLGSAARPIAARLARQVRETVNLVVLDGTHTVCIDQVLGSASVTTVNWLGKRSPTHLAASGKAMLAHLPREALLAHLSEPLAAPTSSSITDPARLLAELADIRRRGWARSIDEQEDGLTSVAAPVRSPDGVVVAALAVSGPTFRMDPDHAARIGAVTMAAANELSDPTRPHRPAATS